MRSGWRTRFILSEQHRSPHRCHLRLPRELLPRTEGSASREECSFNASFLTLRILFTGAGRVGSMRPTRLRAGHQQNDEPVHFQISQRADYIQNDFFEWVQHNRAIINTRDEPLADPRLFRRLHLIHGDTNVQPASLFLKVGTTRLVLESVGCGRHAHDRPRQRSDGISAALAHVVASMASPPGRRYLG